MPAAGTTLLEMTEVLQLPLGQLVQKPLSVASPSSNSWLPG